MPITSWWTITFIIANRGLCSPRRKHRGSLGANKVVASRLTHLCKEGGPGVQHMVMGRNPHRTPWFSHQNSWDSWMFNHKKIWIHNLSSIPRWFFSFPISGRTTQHTFSKTSGTPWRLRTGEFGAGLAEGPARPSTKRRPHDRRRAERRAHPADATRIRHHRHHGSMVFGGLKKWYIYSNKLVILVISQLHNLRKQHYY